MASSSTTAFQGIAPSTSGTSSTLIRKPAFDVFINHRGPDVKETLASTIYKTLHEMKVTAFLDSEELEYGDFLTTTIEAAIRGATLHIAIFSARYVESPWCLEELSLMLKSGAKIIPVFYYVEPTDVRYVAKMEGKYAADFEKHKQKGRYRPEKLKEWEDALYKVSFYTGPIIKNNDDEARLFKNIVNVVLKEIRNVPLEVAKNPVGLEAAVKDFENTFQPAEGDQGVQVVGIWGMGGSGKTTLAKELYNQRSSSMEKSSFIFDIRDAKDMLHNKQNQLLKDLDARETSDNVNQGKEILKRHLKSFRVLIVMDDVDHADQLDALVPAKDSLPSGSLIIVTTRERQVLRSWHISSVYKMRALDSHHAKQLFCWHAFLQPSPLDGFEKLVKNFLKACDGLPLSLKVFGSQLYGNFCKPYWESMYHKISRILDRDIKKILEVSYNYLDDEEKEAFLDTACFFIGKENSLAIEVWDGSGWSGLHTWERLLNKCLVEIGYKNHIRMHDHLRDLGWEIASKQLPCRLWLPQQIQDYVTENAIGKCCFALQWSKRVSRCQLPFLCYRRFQAFAHKKIAGFLGIFHTHRMNQHHQHDTDTHGRAERIKERNGIRGIKATASEIEEWSSYRWCCLQEALTPSLSGLKLLEITGDYWYQIMGQVSRELVWLRWSNIGQKKLPAQISLKKLRVLELSGEHLKELWAAESDAPVQLRELVISSSDKFQRLPNSIGCLKELKKIVISFGKNLRILPEEFCQLQMLEHLDLQSCKMLSSLPSNFGNLTNLRYLDLSWCVNLSRLPVSFKNLISLEYLKLDYCKELTLTSDDFQNITKLKVLKLYSCGQLEELPRHITNQASLRALSLFHLSKLREIPIKIGQLSRLQNLKIRCFLITSLPDSLGDLFSLTKLSIRYCDRLKSLPTSLGNLSSLTHLDIENCDGLESLPTSLENLSCLTNLRIVSCEKVKYLTFSFGRLNLLEDLFICECPISQVDFEAGSSSSASSNLKQMTLQGTKVCRISISEGRYQRLESLKLRYNNHLTEIEALPVNLARLHIFGCPKLDKLLSFARFTSLREFRVEDGHRIEKIQGLQNCTRLEDLNLETCWEAPGIESLERMGKLRKVKLRANKGSAIESCIQSIKNWPDEIIIYAQAVLDASSLVDSFKHGLPPELFVVESSNNEIISEPELHSPIGSPIMVCFVVHSLATSFLELCNGGQCYGLPIGEGKWALIGVFTQHSGRPGERRFGLSADDRFSSEVKVERGLAVRGEKQRLVEALFALCKSIWR